MTIATKQLSVLLSLSLVCSVAFASEIEQTL
jgi:hypothetical protein